MWRIGRCFGAIFERLERQEGNVTTRGVLCSGCLGGCGAAKSQYGGGVEL